ncbi:ATPase [candidate division WOR-3 bacterium]|uniref:ATPase n=1 Tax=candidate division WOR-3 bacterium TaxID=2052148 RepID=A0A660SKW1_UNCW3|nr:MAG: ATPase [candidate division WOR-3 bacterium]
MEAAPQEIQPTIEKESIIVEKILSEVKKAIIGQDYLLNRLLVGLLADGHLLIEGVPGLAKTFAVRTLARAIKTKFQRIQFTPDLLPADIIGTLVYNQKSGEFTVSRGPIFANLILADEINRAPPKVQSALLEAMQERQVTIGDETHRLDDPFMVLATQNPIEQEGTYPLPEAQIDRFLLKVVITYPDVQEELKIMEQYSVGSEPEIKPVVSPKEILKARELVKKIYIDDRLKNYIVSIVTATRDPKESGVEDLAGMIRYGASPRASIYLATTARALAFTKRRGFVIPEDIKEIAPDVLRHRIIPSYEAEAEEISTDEMIRRILETVEVP